MATGAARALTLAGTWSTRGLLHVLNGRGPGGQVPGAHGSGGLVGIALPGSHVGLP
jgi:hypothetical protein